MFRVSRTYLIPAVAISLFIATGMALVVAPIACRHIGIFMPKRQRVIIQSTTVLEDRTYWKTRFEKMESDAAKGSPLVLNPTTKPYAVTFEDVRIVIRSTGTGHRKHTYWVPTSEREWPQVCDLDGDGFDDLVIFDVGDHVIVALYGDGEGRLIALQVWSGVFISAGLVSDVNSDGRPDFVICKYPNGEYEAWFMTANKN